jgi:hypothetical protein
LVGYYDYTDVCNRRKAKGGRRSATEFVCDIYDLATCMSLICASLCGNALAGMIGFC